MTNLFAPAGGGVGPGDGQLALVRAAQPDSEGLGPSHGLSLSDSMGCLNWHVDWLGLHGPGRLGRGTATFKLKGRDIMTVTVAPYRDWPHDIMISESSLAFRFMPASVFGSLASLASDSDG
jgi:hypothetical protein